MQVYQTDYDGIFTGATYAEPDPMVEGNWLIPSGCVSVPPPKLKGDEFAVWDGGAWRIETPPAPVPKPTPTVNDLRAGATVAMATWIAQFLEQFTSGVPAAELASWPVKAERARQHLAGKAQAMIAAEAALTGEDATALAQKIADKADAYEAIIARVTGLRRATEAAIAEAETPEAVSAVLEAAKTQATAMAASLGVGAG